MAEFLLIGYVVVALIVMIITAIDNARTNHFLTGPPSAFLTGVFWPVLAVWLAFHLIRTALSKSEGRS